MLFLTRRGDIVVTVLDPAKPQEWLPLDFRFGAVRCGKTIELELNDGLSKADAEKRVKDMCEKLLANTVVERYSIEIG